MHHQSKRYLKSKLLYLIICIVTFDIALKILTWSKLIFHALHSSLFKSFIEPLMRFGS